MHSALREINAKLKNDDKGRMVGSDDESEVQNVKMRRVNLEISVDDLDRYSEAISRTTKTSIQPVSRFGSEFSQLPDRFSHVN